MKLLTERQSQILAFIRESITNKHRPPTVREIMDRFGIRSSNGAFCHLKALANKGIIHLDSRQACGIRLTGVKVILQDI